MTLRAAAGWSRSRDRLYRPTDMSIRLCLVFVFVVVAGTAACSPNVNTLRSRSAFDLECGGDQLQITELNSGNAAYGGTGAVYGVAGCGRRATYIYSGGHVWVMDSSSTQAQPVGSAQPK
jgi:hypothetical protein